jgi:hypothetical protein
MCGVICDVICGVICGVICVTCDLKVEVVVWCGIGFGDFKDR